MSLGSRVSKKQSGEQTKRSIILTAKKLFVEKGYFNTSMRDIAKEAGVSTGALYHHFESKEEIAGEIYRETVEKIKERLEKALREGEGAREKIKGVIRELLILAEEDRYTMEYALYVKHREILDVPVCSAEPMDLLKKFCREEIDKGRIRAIDPELCAVCITAAPVRLMQLKWDGVIKEPLTSYADSLGECVWRSLSP
ncbi:TetR family transcriptional regulator [Hydrogenivirga caldilitoris]|uniref:TetR family transcriptional regulator n=1 Tax=Hydrogenivirga caldilitoris TaxID=246264 RepID=A0A497XTV0_9AQUI|nr:TetR family transcriptional regulator [Hydrogenivirga caldilitoris]